MKTLKNIGSYKFKYKYSRKHLNRYIDESGQPGEETVEKNVAYANSQQLLIMVSRVI